MPTAARPTSTTLRPNLILTSHYLEALKMQARSSEMAALLGGKMPHVMTSIPGGNMWVPTESKLDDLLAMATEIRDWVNDTVLADTVMLAKLYPEVLTFGKGCGRYIAWGVFEGPDWPYGDNYTEQMLNRYLPMAVLDEQFQASDVQENLITEYMGRSWYKGSETYTSPYFVTDPDFTEYNVDDRYSWVKAPAYDGKPMEAGSMARIFAAYVRGVPFIKEQVDAVLGILGAKPGDLAAFQSTLGRTAIRQIETIYIANLMVEWVNELAEAIKGGDSEYFREPARLTGEGTGFWEAPRGALYHSEKVVDGKIEGYQIIIPSTWNLAPINGDGEHGPLEQALDRRSGGRHREAHQRPAHGSLLRPLHRLRRARHGARYRQALRDRHQPLGGEVRWPISLTTKRPILLSSW